MTISSATKMNSVLVEVGVTVFVRDAVAVCDGELVKVGVCVDVAVFVGDDVGVDEDVADVVGVGDDVAVGVGEAVAVFVDAFSMVVELADLGVPLIGLPFASSPFRVIPLFVPHIVSLSPNDMRSCVAYSGDPLPIVPPGQAPPSKFTVSITLPLASLRKRISPLLPKEPE